MNNINVLPIFNQAAPGIWEDFLRIRAFAMRHIYNHHVSHAETVALRNEYELNWRRRGFNFAFGAYDGTDLIGFVNGDCCDRVATIRGLYVLPECMSKHVGSTLLKSAENTGAIAACELDLVSLLKSRGFYEHNGYTPIMHGSNRYSKSTLLLLENKNSMHRCPYRQKLMTDAKANSAMAIDSIFPPVSPITSTNACCAAAPQGTTPLAKIASAVTVQTKMVSQKTSSIPQNPCSTGLVAPLHACAIEALPSPASWVKIPRAIPTRIEVNSPTLVPATPATGEANASVKISLGEISE